MKKTATTLLLAIFALNISAQTAADALMFSESNYEGTARSVAMGNAFTALGGDLGAVTINPAGSAVAKYSQVTLTPGLTFSASTSQGLSPYKGAAPDFFERKMRSKTTRFSIPNVGFSFNWNTNRQYGLKNMAFGFIINKTGGWNEDTYANGHNSTTSFMGELAYDASVNGYIDSEIAGDAAFDIFPWKTVIGYDTGMIAPFDDRNNEYIGASEVYSKGSDGDVSIWQAGELEQTLGRKVTGSRYEYIFNIGGNISDFFYFGANIGISSVSYNYDYYFKETAMDPTDFEIVTKKLYFDTMKYTYGYSATGTGVFGKFGFIITPGAGIRVGAAIQTPTLTSVKENWEEAAETEFTGIEGGSYSSSSPYGSYEYNIRSPYKANVGLAFTFGKFGVISADYELCDYRTMKFKHRYSDDRERFDILNNDIRELYRISHSMRSGVEIRPVNGLSIRAGYGFTSSPQKESLYMLDKGLYVAEGDKFTHNVSFGLGYSSQGSFFIDAACRHTFANKLYFMPYGDYIFNYDNEGNEYVPNGYFAPEIETARSLWKVMLTLGWRF